MIDTKYPIYRLHWSWTEDDIENHREKYEGTAIQSAGLPDGRRCNSSSNYQMFRTYQHPSKLIALHKEWFLEWDRVQGRNPELVDVVVKSIIEESWCPGWFEHWTFDDGQSDEAALASFIRYVDRMEDYNRKYGKHDKNCGWIDAVCLMGAEDRWRWRGRDNDGNDTQPPCRCAGCKKDGLIRIMH